MSAGRADFPWTQAGLGVLFFVAASTVRVVGLDASFQARDHADPGTDVLASPGPEALAIASFQHPFALADLFWLGVVQEVGKPSMDMKADFGRVERWSHIATDLDPRYYSVYQAASINLAVYGRDFEAAKALLNKGKEHVPEEFFLPFLLGYIAYYHEGEPLRAADHWEEAAQRPNAPAFLASLAGRARYQAGDPMGAEQMLLDMMESLEGPAREAVEIRLKMLRSEPILSQYDRACEGWVEARGERPESAEVLFREGLTTAPPRDLLGDPIELDEGCVARTKHIQVREHEAKERIGRGTGRPPMP